MRTILILIGNELRRFANHKIGLALTFLVPMVLIYIFGSVFGVGRTGGGGPTGILLAIVSQTDVPVSAAITDALRKEKAFKVITTQNDAAGIEQPLTEAKVREMMRAGTLRFALIFPTDTQSDQLFGLKVKFLNNPRNEIETQTVTGLLEKTIYSSAPQALLTGLQKRGADYIGKENFDRFNQSISEAIAQAFGGKAEDISKDMKNGVVNFGQPANGSLFDNLIKIETEQIGGGQVKNPMATRSVGGWAVMFLLFSLTAASTSLFDEKKAGIYQRLLSAPVDRTHILWSKYLSFVLIGVVQLTTLFVAGRFLFGIDITTNFGNLLLICLAAATACVAFGMFLAAISPTSSVATGLGTFLILTMSAVGGAWFPRSFMPEFMQHLSPFTIVFWAMEGFVQVLWANCTTRELLPTLGVLFGIAAVVNTISVWRFKRGNIFE
jgi:ABC-2 type transport system permease protein